MQTAAFTVQLKAVNSTTTRKTTVHLTAFRFQLTRKTRQRASVQTVQVLCARIAAKAVTKKIERAGKRLVCSFYITKYIFTT